MRRALALAAWLAPGAASAHTVSTGLGAFYDGAAHVAAAPEALLAAVAVGLLAGLRGAPAGRAAMAALTLGWALGALVALAAGLAAPPGVTGPLVLIALGLLTALNAPLPPAKVAALAALAGLMHGVALGADIAPDAARLTLLAGATVCVWIAATLTPAAVLALRPAWSRVAVRAAGAWIAAVGMMTAAWTFSSAANAAPS